MALGVGIVGLPNVGKTTLFNALTRAGATVASYAFSTIEPNTAVVSVPDRRLDVLNAMYKPKKVTPTTMTFVDVAGLVAGASKGEGMGNQFLSRIRELDAIAIVVRCFEDGSAPAGGARVDPLADMGMLNLELALADLEVVNKRREKIGGTARFKPNSKEQEELQVLDRIAEHLDAGKPIRSLALSAEEEKLLRSFAFLTAKPVIYVANIAEADIGKETAAVDALRKEAALEGAEVVVLSARLEAELRELPDDEAQAFLEDAGLREPALPAFIHAAYQLLDLLTFLTAGEPEVRAWTVHRGAKAPEAAGVIHTDFERGFIKAEIVSFDELAAAGSYAAARERGKVRLEGREYVMQDGDVCLFRFNV
ncbi:MAG TPA: redox-regulated ATPase YchF [Candidatus Limnocylindrales bacterium]|nr:redox-regulated ATPase YchF [Candidatus Limnocylindrales bacterium]